MLLGSMGGIDATIVFIAGLVFSLYGWGRLGKKPGVDPIHDARIARVRRVLRVLGPLLMVGAIIQPFLEPSPAPTPPVQWRTAITSDGVCRVDMPGEPSEQGTPSDLGKVAKPATQQLLLVEENGRVQYLLSHSDIEGEYAKLSPEKLLETIGNNWFLAANNKEDAQRIGERDLSDKGWPGRELAIDREGQRMQNRWFVVNKRLYRAYVLTLRDDKHLRDARRFLDSFHVRKTVPAEKGS
jgi:hypothetical protein